MTTSTASRGSVWLRWDPHIHVPGTLLNDQYSGADPWGDFESRLTSAKPAIDAIGITDYFTVATYEQALTRRAADPTRWPAFVFPNIEMRFGVESAKTAAINVHLLCSPVDSDHVEQIKRFLRHLTFPFRGETYRCEDADLARLGRAHHGEIVDERAARQAGANQFKIAFKDLVGAFDASDWARRNILVAVAGSGRDGTSSLKDDASFAAMRAEIEARADIIFSAQPQQRDFWLGKGAATVEQLRAKWGGCKPCLHGSDAHDHARVGEPDLSRYCWLKGDASFESLHQACIEPDVRVFIGKEPPKGGLESQTIATVTVDNAPWLTVPRLDLNAGLVAIIGARGSGKTALADLIAAGAYSATPDSNDRSFLHRARDYLQQEKVSVGWASGETTGGRVLDARVADLLDTPRVRYLSQQFVEQLCSAEGLTDELVHEIERVILAAFPVHERLGATTFSELLEIRCEQAQRSRARYENDLVEITEQLAAERQKQAALPLLKKQKIEIEGVIKKDKGERTTLLGKSTDSRAKRLEQIASAVETARARVDAAKRKHRALKMLSDEVQELRSRSAPNRLRRLKTDYAEAGLSDQQWNQFDVDFRGDVDAVLTAAIAAALKHVRDLEGPAPGEPAFIEGAQNPNVPYVPDAADLGALTLSLLEKEHARLQALAGVDAQNAKLVARLSEKIARDEAVLTKKVETIADAEGAGERIAQVVKERTDAYRGVFDAVVNEQAELRELYAPLATRLGEQSGALAKLGFAVRRIVNIEAWASDGEELLDLRKSGPFRGKGTLLATGNEVLGRAWREGTAEEVATAMATFREQNERALVEHMPDDVRTSDQRREWGAKIARWLYDTSHVRLAYNIQYDGVDIEQLSPGTRGIVLLLLYLAIDSDDDRPIIIDQPEENLDPKSVHDELVDRFRAARLRRQIIIVTHNANLVVNTDADQVIVAECGAHRPGRLPEIKYTAGGLENPEIRRMVCEILEGGDAAFKERAKRLRVRLP